MISIQCELGCGTVLGTGETFEDAHEDAVYVNGFQYDPEAGVYVCTACADAEMRRMMVGFNKYYREYTDDQLAQDYDDYVSHMEIAIAIDKGY